MADSTLNRDSSVLFPHILIRNYKGHILSNKSGLAFLFTYKLMHPGTIDNQLVR